MTPEGIKLFKRAFLGLLCFFVILIGYQGFKSLSSGLSSGKNEVSQLQNQISPDFLANLNSADAPETIHSAKQGLIARLHFYAYNYYRSNRFKNAIDTWDSLKFLAPNDPVIDLRLKEARAALDRLVEQNVILGNLDYGYMRYSRAIHFWTRAANLAAGVDPKKYEEIQFQIQIAERYIK